MRLAPQLKADLTLLVITFLWGSTFVIVKDAVHRFPVFWFLTLRFGFGLVGLLAILAARRRRSSPSHGGIHRSSQESRTQSFGWVKGIATGFFLFLGYAFQTAGLIDTTSGRAGFITGLSVVIVPLLAAIIYRTRIPRATIFGVSLATSGLYLMSWGADATAGFGRGDLLVLACAFAFAFHIVAIARFGAQTDEFHFSGFQMLTVASLSLMWAIRYEGPMPAIDGGVAATAAFTGIVVTALVLLWQTRAQRIAPPTHTAVIFTMEPVFAALFGYLLAGEVLHPRGLVGAVLILTGMLASEVGALKPRFLRLNGRRPSVDETPR